MVTWTLTYLIHSTILIGAVLIASRWIRSAFTRDLLWKLALVGGVVTATIQLTVPFERLRPIDVPVNRVIPSSFGASLVSTNSATDAAAVQSRHIQAKQTAQESSRQPRAQRLTPLQSLAAGWSVIALLLLARLAIGFTRLTHSLRDRREIVLGDDRVLLDEICRHAGWSRLVRLTSSDMVASPIAMMSSEIVIPRAIFAALTREQKESILAHEVAHLMRRDPAWLTLGELIRAVLFFQPLNWIAPARIRQTAEFLCDDAAVRHTGNRVALAETLATLANSIRGRHPVAVAAMAEGGSHLVDRVSRVLSEHSEKPLRLIAQLLIATCAVVLVAGFAPGMSLSHDAEPELQTVVAAAGAVEVEVEPVADPEPVKPVNTTRQTSQGKKTEVRHLGDGVVAKFGHITLNQNFTGPDGRTRVELQARDGEIALDPFRVTVSGPGGYVRANEKSERGPFREVEIRESRSGQQEYLYKVDGVEKPWSEDAQRVIAANFIKSGAYVGARPATQQRSSRDEGREVTVVGQNLKWHTWNGNVHLTGDRDDVPMELVIRVTDVQYNEAGQVRFTAGSSVRIEETIGGRTRRFSRTYDEIHWTGSEGYAPETPNEEWVIGLLREHNKIPLAVARAIVETE